MIMTTNQFVTHETPVWRDRANFLIFAVVDPDAERAVVRWEQLWARQLQQYRFEICCIPFFPYNLALGDEVETKPFKDKIYVVDHVVTPSLRYVYRAWFSTPQMRGIVHSQLESLGCLLEWRSTNSNLLAVDCSSLELAQTTADILMNHEQHGVLVYETGKLTQY
jgi:hypothetical protein